MRSAKILTLLSPLAATPALACPVCETGTDEAALFIATTIGLFAVGGLFFFLGTRRSVGLPARGPLDVETPRGGRDG